MRYAIAFLFAALSFNSQLQAAGVCDEQDARLFETYIEKRQEQKRILISTTMNTAIAGVRIENRKPYTGGYAGVRIYSHQEGARYLNGRHSGDEAFHNGPLWAPGPIKIFLDQDEKANGPLDLSHPDQLSKINLTTYQLSDCDMDATSALTGAHVLRFEIAPRKNIEGAWYGFIEVDPKTLLTLAEVSSKTILSDRARSNLGGRMTEFNFKRYFRIVDGRVSIPYLFSTHAKSRWAQYSDVKIEARFELVDYKTGDR
ncbi:MAG: hypothetical protein ABL958_09555 [Bdellovibrionia bacterium]